MAKGSSQVSSMWEIRNPDGRPFDSLTEQKGFIREHFANSFKRPQHEPDNLEGCIENFLGPAVLDHPLTRNLKLSEDEKNRLEADLTADELDAALDGANLNSAAGIDGISTKFIKRFWHIFRIPLLKYSWCAFRNGQLTQSFKTAIIKLIPSNRVISSPFSHKTFFFRKLCEGTQYFFSGRKFRKKLL
jgi:hypothetical protein